MSILNSTVVFHPVFHHQQPTLHFTHYSILPQPTHLVLLHAMQVQCQYSKVDSYIDRKSSCHDTVFNDTSFRHSIILNGMWWAIIEQCWIIFFSFQECWDLWYAMDWQSWSRKVQSSCRDLWWTNRFVAKIFFILYHIYYLTSQLFTSIFWFLFVKQCQQFGKLSVVNFHINYKLFIL